MSDEIVKKVRKHGFVTVNEPALGSGATITAMMLEMQERGLSYQRHVHVIATDLDSTAAIMAYVQLFLMHVHEIIVHGNTLPLDESSRWSPPAHMMNNWSSRLSRARAETALPTMLADARSPSDDADGYAHAEPEVPRGG
jgi:hypothetical protein